MVSDEHVTSDGREDASKLHGRRLPVIYRLQFCLSRVSYDMCAWLGTPADGQDLVLAPSVQCFQNQMGRIKTLAVACLCLGGHLDEPALASKFDA